MRLPFSSVPPDGIEKRRRPFDSDAAKFTTQKIVTYILLSLFCYVTLLIIMQNDGDQSERSMILQTVINLAFLAAGYWLGSSKQAADQHQGATPVAPIQQPEK